MVVCVVRVRVRYGTRHAVCGVGVGVRVPCANRLLLLMLLLIGSARTGQVDATTRVFFHALSSSTVFLAQLEFVERPAEACMLEASERLATKV